MKPEVQDIETDEPSIYTLGHPGLMQLVYDRKGAGGIVYLTGGTPKDAEADDQRKELIERSRRGEHIEVVMQAVTYRQHDDHPDANFSDFSPSALQRMVKSAPGTAFLRDHKLRDTAAVGGYCEGCTLKTLDDGTKELHETVVLSKPWAVESVLDGTMRRFSIGARPRGGIKNVVCRVCNDTVAQCGHYPGEVVETRSGPKEVVWRYKDAVMLERSWVLDPAVENTHIIGWVEKARSQGKIQSMDDIREIKTEDKAALAAIELERDSLKAANADMAASLETVKAELASVKAELGSIKTDTEAKAVEAQIGELLKSGKLAPNGTQEKQIRERVGSGDLIGAKALLAFAAAGPSVTLAGAPPQSAPVTIEGVGKPDWSALFAALPQHLRDMAGPLHNKNPEAFIRANKETLARYGVTVPGLN